MIRPERFEYALHIDNRAAIVFDFQRNELASGLYFFKIEMENGTLFSGKIIVMDE
jgi:hypothetical protein